MKNGVFIRRGARREEGMALLFALGFLALMLILGLGFVTTSLLAQKLAANNSGRAQARMYARSAMARAMLNIMLYNDQAVLKGETIDNYDSICSYDKVKFNVSGTTGEDAVSDQLRKSGANDDSKLKYQPGTEENYTGDSCNAKWMYFYDAPEGVEGRRIIGRAAYQVLPRKSSGRLSLYAVTGGSTVKNEYGALPINYRWGRDIAELNLTPTQTLASWYGSVKENNIPFKFETMYTSYGSFFKAADNSEGEKKKSENKKRWLEYWFAEGKNPILKDAFPVLESTTTRYYNRFNISDFYYSTDERNNSGNDNWYDRFKKIVGDRARANGWEDANFDQNKNSKAALDALTQEAVEYNENHTTDLNADPSGLPFLKRIGNEAWSFETIDLLRRQIAANFNDYCDADSIPTSDVKASAWKITDADDALPKYTGNERTLYINEVAARIHDITLDYDQNQNSETYGSPKITKISLNLLLELINMYDNSDDIAAADKQLLDPAHVKAAVGLKKLNFKIGLSGEYTVKVTYKIGARERTLRFTHLVNENYDKPAYNAEVNYAPDAAALTMTIDSFPALSKGYSVGRTAAKDLLDSVSPLNVTNLKSEIETVARSKVPSSGTYVKFEIERVRLAHKIVNSDVKMELAPALLQAKDDLTVTVGGATRNLCPAGTGIDFVRFKDEMSFSPGNIDADTLRTSGTASARNYYIGGIEAKDPRQNLNPRYSTGETVHSDWTIDPKLLTRENAVYTLGSTPPAGAPSMELPENLGNEFYGRVNRDASPAKTSSETDGPDPKADKETATDPAWLGSDVDKHVSTAYIRNAPMVSPWEIGLIHRGREWQTLNLKSAGGLGANQEVMLKEIGSGYDDWTGAGTTYANGDGAILEFVKVGVNCRSMGKIPLSLFKKTNIAGSDDDTLGENKVSGKMNRDILRMLFSGVRYGQSMKEFYAETKFDSPSQQGGDTRSEADINTVINTEEVGKLGMVAELDRLCGITDNDTKFRMRSQLLNSNYGAASDDPANPAFTFGLAKTTNDALREEFIGKTINLLTVDEETPPNVFRVIIVAQSIKDVGGIGSDVEITKIHNGVKTPLKCQIGRFDYYRDPDDWEKNTYFDEIIGEVKALVTIERVPVVDENGEKNKNYGRMVVTGIEFID